VREDDPLPPWRNTAIVAFTGMRGAVSLAAALAVPESLPGRDLLVFLVFTTIVWTVCLEGLSLPWLLRVLHVHDDGQAEREEYKARYKAAGAAIRRVDELAGESWVRDDSAERIRGLYDFRRRRFASRLGKVEEDGAEDPNERSSDFQRLQRELLQAQRDELLALRRAGAIGDEIMRRIERDLDLEETRLESAG
jgi:CPA1 family monovalent cation:H+ antiporter